MTLDPLDHCAQDLTRAYGQHDVLSVTVRADGKQCRIICPAGREADLALLLYLAADTMAEHAPNPHKA